MAYPTRPLPPVGGPLPGDAPPPTTPPPTTRPPWPARALDTTAGLMSGGLLLIGVVLLGFQLLAPSLMSGSGLAKASGPGWDRVAGHLAVGIAGEVLVLVRHRVPPWVRVVADLLVLTGVVLELWFAWWR